ncbi:hypothetical protein [Herbaspirillum rhizosphaerae]|uniref:hypothetical protein n=1 Tax=Herbaspirillum rhizosphaerae TaxID=346179 RepID=UPI00067DAE50|nr:hypothetical protein [Herbaspirillum rhizosphaerae]
MPQSLQGDLQFDVEQRSDGMRIYARYGSEVVAGLAAEFLGNYLAISVVYVAPSWRGTAVSEALQVQFFHCLDALAE